MKTLFTVVILFTTLALSSCKSKSETEPAAAELTSCPANENCSYKYYDNRIYQDRMLKNGSHRVFEAKFIQPGIIKSFYINAPLNGTEFSLSGKDIREGAVIYNFSCPTCDYIGLEPVDGKIEGKGWSGGKWLIDATIILANEQANYRDTVKIRQYFLP